MICVCRGYRNRYSYTFLIVCVMYCPHGSRQNALLMYRFQMFPCRLAHRSFYVTQEPLIKYRSGVLTHLVRLYSIHSRPE